MEGKKAQGLSITTIILIILGVLVLVMLIIGFTAGWGSIKDWIAPSNNVQQIVSQCQSACAAGSKYDFCSVERVLKEKGEDEVTGSCKELSSNTKYGIEECNAITCDSGEEGGKTCQGDEVKGTWTTGDCVDPKPNIYNGDLSDADEHLDKKCCVA